MKILIAICALIASFALYGFYGVPGKQVSKNTDEKPTCVEQTKDDQSCFTSIEQYQAWKDCVKRTGNERKCYLTTIAAPRPMTCIEKPGELIDCFDDKEKYRAWQDCVKKTGNTLKCFDSIVKPSPDPEPTPDPEPPEPTLAEVEVPEFRGDGRDLGLDVTQVLINGEYRHQAYAVTSDGALARLEETEDGWSSCRPLDGTNFIAGKISAVSWLEPPQSGSQIWRRFLFATHPLGGLRIVRTDDSGDFDIFGPLDVSGQPNPIVRGSPSAVVIPSLVYSGRHEARAYIGSDQGLVEYVFVERSSGPFLPGHLIPLGDASSFADPASFGNPVAISYLHQGDFYIRVFLIANTDGFPNGELLEARKKDPGQTNPPWEWIRHGSPDVNRRFGSIAVTQWMEPQPEPRVAIAGLATTGSEGSSRFYVAEGGHLGSARWHDADYFTSNGSEPIIMSSVMGSGSSQQSHVLAMAVANDYRLYYVVRHLGGYVQATQPVLDTDGTPVNFYGGVGASGTYVNGSWFVLGRDTANPSVDTFFVRRYGGAFEGQIIMNESLCP
jgi:hypothetical protein